MPSKEEVMKAVRDLRAELGFTQAQFALSLGYGMSTIQRWEQVVPPRGAALLKLAVLAGDHGRSDLFTVFKDALEIELGSGKYVTAGMMARPKLREIRGQLHLIRHALENPKDTPANRIKWALAITAELLPAIDLLIDAFQLEEGAPTSAEQAEKKESQ